MNPYENNQIKVTMREPEIDKRISALRCLLSPVTKQVIEEKIAQFFFDCGSDVEHYEYHISQGCYAGTLNIYINHDGGDEIYDWMMNQKDTSIDKNIWYYASEDIVFVSHDNTQITVVFSIRCPLPDDDFKTLDMLGKVHREYKPGKMETSIFCAI